VTVLPTLELQPLRIMAIEPPASGTETSAALKVEIDTWRWVGVPFYLRTGKRLQDRLTELVVTFDEVPHPIFEKPPTTRTANELVIRLRPAASSPMIGRDEYAWHDEL
jgi:glucose-6-phosphate 1-dehydrogenase